MTIRDESLGVLLADEQTGAESADWDLDRSADRSTGRTADGAVPHDICDPDAMPLAGSPVVIVPRDGDEPVAGEVTLWSAGMVGMVVTARVEVGAGAANALNEQRVWVRARAPKALVVIQALAKVVGGRPDELELTGVTGLAVETRRKAPRARIERTILLLRDGAPSRGTSTLDMSSTGCRVRLSPDQPLWVGDRVQTVVTSADGEPIWLLSEVVRVDSAAQEAALHFIDVSESDRFTLERDVLGWLDTRAAVR